MQCIICLYHLVSVSLAGFEILSRYNVENELGRCQAFFFIQFIRVSLVEPFHHEHICFESCCWYLPMRLWFTSHAVILYRT